MELSLLTPFGGLLAVAGFLPLGVYARRQRRIRGIRAALGLPEPPPVARLPLPISLAATAAILGLAAAQPILESDRMRPERSDAEVFVVLDTSRSMLASAGPNAPTRYERARAATLALRDELPEVPLGLASLTDRLLPHVFPTTDRRVIDRAIHETMGIERPPPSQSYFGGITTTLGALSAVPARNYFSPSARRRLLVVLTDGETDRVESDLAGAFRRPPRISTLLVRFGEAGEGIFETGVREDAYRPNPAGGAAALEQIASAVGGRVFSERELEGVQAAARSALGEGPTRQRVLEGERVALMPYVTLAAVLPLAFILLRRNL